MNKLIVVFIFNIFIILSSSYAQDEHEEKQWWIENSFNKVGANLRNAWEIVGNVYEPKIAVIDTGFDVNHEDYKDSILINEDEIPNNNIDDDGNGYVDDYLGYNSNLRNGNIRGAGDHGTHILGTISAKHNNGVGIKGVTNGFKLIPIIKHARMADDASKLPGLVKAFEYAIDRGADVISFSQKLLVTSKAFEAVIKRAYLKNIIIVVSAGNMSKKNSHRYPGSYADKYSNIIVVANSDKKSFMNYTSNYGKETVHIFAPGTKIYASVNRSRYGYKSGTSMATPIVAGVVALVLATHGPSSASTMRQRLIDTSKRFETMSGKVYSNGLIDAYNAITGQSSFNFIWKSF